MTSLIINGIDFSEVLDRERDALHQKIDLQFLAFDFFYFRLSEEVESHLKQVEFLTDLIDKVAWISRAIA